MFYKYPSKETHQVLFLVDLCNRKTICLLAGIIWGNNDLPADGCFGIACSLKAGSPLNDYCFHSEKAQLDIAAFKVKAKNKGSCKSSKWAILYKVEHYGILQVY